MANPINSFLTGAATAGTILVIRNIQGGDFIQNFIISILVVCCVIAFFIFVVRDENYQFKLWYGIDEITIPRVVRGIAWLSGLAVILLMLEIR